MKISTKGRYAIRLMIDIAEHEKVGNVSIKDVAKRQDISLKYLEQIVNALGKAGYLKSRRGSQGGYQLTKAPEEYTVAEILRVTEGNFAPVACLEDEENTCPNRSRCSTIKMWEGLYKVVEEYLSGITIADLLKEKDAKNGDFGYYI